MVQEGHFDEDIKIKSLIFVDVGSRESIPERSDNNCKVPKQSIFGMLEEGTGGKSEWTEKNELGMRSQK